MMDFVSKNLYVGSKILPPIPSPTQTSILVPPPRLPYSSDTSFPIIAIAVVGIIAMTFLLVTYYIFVIKCCLNLHTINLFNHLSISSNQNQDDPLMAGTLETAPRGLDESVIRSIPVFKFRKEGAKSGTEERSFCTCECAVCLNEFQEDERLKIIPNCSHVFHVDCIDAWLQNNANCPLCRTSILGTTRLFPLDHIIVPSSTPQDLTRSEDNDDDYYVVIELGDYNNVSALQQRISPLPWKLDQRGVQKKGRKLVSKVESRGDECIDVRGQDNEFGIQPIRRSFSMDSLVDRQLFLAVQEVVQERRQVTKDITLEARSCSSSSSSNSSSISMSNCRRTCFSFGHGGRGSRNAVFPVKFEP